MLPILQVKTFRVTLVLVSCVVAFGFTPAPLLADGNDKIRERKDAERTKKAAKELESAKEGSKDAAKELAEAVQALKTAEKVRDTQSANIRKLKESIRDEYEVKLKFPAAMAKQKETQEQFDAAASPVLSKLKATNEYADATRAATLAKESMESVQKDNSLSSQVRDERISELTKRILFPGELEKKALQANPQASEARGRLDAANSRVADLRKDVNSSVQSDPRLAKAQQALDNANAEMERVKVEIQKRQQQAIRAQQKVNKEQVDLQRAKLQDKANDGKRRK